MDRTDDRDRALEDQERRPDHAGDIDDMCRTTDTPPTPSVVKSGSVRIRDVNALDPEYPDLRESVSQKITHKLGWTRSLRGAPR